MFAETMGTNGRVSIRTGPTLKRLCIWGMSKVITADQYLLYLRYPDNLPTLLKCLRIENFALGRVLQEASLRLRHGRHRSSHYMQGSYFYYLSSEGPTLAFLATEVLEFSYKGRGSMDARLCRETLASRRSGEG